MKKASVVALVLALMFLAGTAIHPQNRIAAILCVSASLIGTAVNVAFFRSDRAALRITRDGFSYRTLRAQHRYHWSDIGHFGVTRIGATEVVGFTLRDSASIVVSTTKGINMHTLGFHAFLPDTYGKKPTALAELLESWRSKES